MNSRLLVADSDPALCEAYGDYFSSRGFDVKTAHDGLECLEQTWQFWPSFMLLEWEIPWGGGAGVLARLRDELLDATPHVVVTSDQDVDQLIPLVTDNVVACVRKPFRLESVLAVLRSEYAADRHG